MFMHADLIFNEKSQTINIRKGMFLNINCLAIYVQKHSVSNIVCNLWKSPLTSNFFGKTLIFPDFSMTLFIFLDFPD